MTNIEFQKFLLKEYTVVDAIDIDLLKVTLKEFSIYIHFTGTHVSILTCCPVQITENNNKSVVIEVSDGIKDDYTNVKNILDSLTK